MKADLGAAESLGTDIALGLVDLAKQAHELQETFGRVSPQLSNSMLVGSAAALTADVVGLVDQARQQATQMAIDLINVNHYYS